MSLKNEAQSAFRNTRHFYREYVSGVDRKTIGKELREDTEKLKKLYSEAAGSQYREDNSSGPSAVLKFYRFFLALTGRLNPTRRLIFGITCILFVAHYLFSVLGLTGYFLHPLLIPLAFGGVAAILLIELLEKTDAKRELDLAREIQLSLLPATESIGDDLEIYAFAHTAREVGGDYVDIIRTEKGVYIIIADVSGKGLTAALYMVRIQALVHLLIEKTSPSPKELFLQLNDYIKSKKSDKTFVTACAAFFPVNETRFVFARAGQNPPVIYSSGNDSTYHLKTGGLALGMAPDPVLRHQLQEKSYHFNPGDSVLFYTDGLSEARNEVGLEYGEAELDTLMSIYGGLHAKSISAKIQTSLEAFIGSQKPADDITFAVVRRAKKS